MRENFYRSVRSKIKSKPAVENFFQIQVGCFQLVNSRIKKEDRRKSVFFWLFVNKD